MYPGARVQLSDGVHLDLYLGMKAKGEMDRFVMGVYLPTTSPLPTPPCSVLAYLESAAYGLFLQLIAAASS
jgi:hypothetical protein